MDPVLMAEAVGLIDIILSLSSAIHSLVQNVKENKERCRQIEDRVEALEDLVRSIKEKKPQRISNNVMESLKQLCQSLDAAKTLVTRFGQTKRTQSIVKSHSLKDDFRKMDKRLRDNLEMLVSALVVDQGSVLNNVYETVKKTGPRHRATVLPQPATAIPTATATATAATAALQPVAATATTSALQPVAATGAMSPTFCAPMMPPYAAVMPPYAAMMPPYAAMTAPYAAMTPISFSNVFSRPGSGANIVINSTINPSIYSPISPSITLPTLSPSSAAGALVLSRRVLL
ncbi:uncharacterized protein V6R79_008643 [Siganus canaliculatus]